MKIKNRRKNLKGQQNYKITKLKQKLNYNKINKIK